MKTFFPGSTHNSSRAIAFDSRMPRSTILASSTASSLGGPGSNEGEARGTSSAFTVRTPLSGTSGNGSPTSIFIPTNTSVLPRRTRAEPSARPATPVSSWNSRWSVNPRPSSLFP